MMRDPDDPRRVLVGERGPELFIPTQDGKIIPNSAFLREGEED